MKWIGLVLLGLMLLGNCSLSLPPETEIGMVEPIEWGSQRLPPQCFVFCAE